jgi:hypothetical protein
VFRFLIIFSLLASASGAVAQPRNSPNWVRDGVIYEIYPRAFSQQGNFNGITARLDELKDLGVTILWLMPIHPIGQEKKKGTIGRWLTRSVLFVDEARSARSEPGACRSLLTDDRAQSRRR